MDEDKAVIKRVRLFRNLAFALLIIIYFTLRKNRKYETRPDLLAALEGNVKLVNYLMLLAMPIIATAFYRFALAANLGRFPVNVAIFYYITAPAGTVMLILSLLQTFRQGLSKNISLGNRDISL